MRPVASEASSASVELDLLLAVVAELAATDLGRERLAALPPTADPELLELRRRRYTEAAGLLAERRLVGSLDFPLGELLGRLRSDRPSLDGAALVRFGDLLRETNEARERILTADPAVPELSTLAGALPDLSELGRKIAGAFDRRGQVRPDASPKLGQLRDRVHRLRDRLYQDLSGFVENQGEHLSEDTIPLRDGRLVVLLSSGAKGRVPGLVHGKSGTGRSFYFEPLEVVDANNSLKSTVEDEEAERARILAELVALVRAAEADLELHADFLANLDVLQAAHRFGELTGGRLADTAVRGELRLIGARHPLLDPALASLRERALGAPGHQGEVIPLDLELGGERTALIITGPNAGGKTVALKTLGLMALAHQCGLPIPVEGGTVLPTFAEVLAVVGDEQDLLTERSTFSGRLLRLKAVWERADADSLVLVDELGSGTDPAEGSALAVALLEGLVERSSLAFITTHLTPLAAAALELDGAGCAAMEFDGDAPTFLLVPGPPGGSEAIALARRLGLPSEWLDRAEAKLGSGHRDLTRLLAEVERLRRELSDERSELRQERTRAEAETARLAAEQAALKVEKKRLSAKLSNEVAEFRRETREKLGKEVERLKAELEAGRRKQLAAKATERLFEEAPELPVEPDEPAGPVVVGGTVKHRLLGWQGELVKLEGKKAEVRAGGKTLRCGADELEGVAAPVAAAKRPSSIGGRRSSGPGLGTDEPEELNLIGQRVEEALDALDVFLDRALLSSVASVRVVHGHGTGRLKKAVREHLRRHRAVGSYRAGGEREGGDGATFVSLRG